MDYTGNGYWILIHMDRYRIQFSFTISKISNSLLPYMRVDKELEGR